MPKGVYERAVRPASERLFARLDCSDPNACWNWPGATTAFGHGQLKGDRRGPVMAHRTAWEAVNGTIPDGLCVLHRCDNPKCCNPGHLFLGTRTDNAADKVAKGRQARGTAFRTTRLSVEDLEAIKAMRGTSQRLVAAKFGISPSYVSMIQTGRARRSGAR